MFFFLIFRILFIKIKSYHIHISKSLKKYVLKLCPYLFEKKNSIYFCYLKKALNSILVNFVSSNLNIDFLV